VIVPGLPQDAEVNVVANDMHAPANNGDAPLRMLRFTTPPDGNTETVVKTSVAAMPNGLHIDQFSEIAGMMRSVQFIQQIPIMFEPGEMNSATEEPRVRLHVNVSYPDDSNRQAVRQLYTADSFSELREKHPREVSTYLTPLLLQLQQDEVVAPDLATARRALASGATTAPAIELQDKVNELVKQLAAADQTARGDAFRSLQALGETGINAVGAIDRSTLSAEQNNLLDLLLTDETGSPPADNVDLAADPIFLVDSLSLKDPGLRGSAFDRLKKLTSLTDLNFDPNATDLTRRAQVISIRTKIDGWMATKMPMGQ